MEKASLSKATLGRLPEYLNFLRTLDKKKTPYISATAIAKALSRGEVQVRKDLNSLSGAGRPKVGYETASLIKCLTEHLGTEAMTPAILVGAGKLGRALLNYDGFMDFGVEIVAAFDCNEFTYTIGSAQKTVLPIDKMEAFCKERGVKIGIITVGVGSAQPVCDKLVGCGIRAIWNFASCRLDVPEDVIVKHENLALSLAHLNNQTLAHLNNPSG